MKNHFVKNLYQILSFAASLVTVSIPLFVVAIMATFKHEYTTSLFFFLIIVGLFLLFGGIGFYWIFQWVEIDRTGIQVFLIRKKIKEIKWEDVEAIGKCGYMRNPALRFVIKNQKDFHLDTRKSIIRAMQYFAPQLDEKLTNFHFEK